MKRLLWTLVLLAALAALAACPSKPDTDKERAIVLDGRAHDVALGPAAGEIAEGESGMARSGAYSVFFPAGAAARGGGVRIMITRPVAAGSTIAFGAKAADSPVRVRYVSPSGLAEYSTGLLDGGGSIAFDEVSLQPGGRVRGRLVRATLFGGGPGATAAKASRMELHNFPFDTAFKAAP